MTALSPLNLSTNDIKLYMIPSKYIDYIHLFKQQLEIINARYLADHIMGVVDSFWVTYRDPDRNWFSKTYKAFLDAQTESIIGTNASKAYYRIMNSDMNDSYLSILIESLNISLKDVPYDENTDTLAINRNIKKWKDDILSKYSRNDHIRVFMWDLLRCEYNREIVYNTETYIRQAFELDDSFSFCLFEYNGLILELEDIVNRRRAKIKTFANIFGNFSIYGNRFRPILQDKEVIEIPQTIYHYSLGDIFINGLGKGVFESLKNCKKIILPKSMKNIEWSFWECKKLERIELPSNPWDELHYKSIDGVLYSGDGLSLCAYPNAHGEIYEVPNGVTTIKKFAFKSCDSIHTIILPSSLKVIEINAFYRCTNLKRIICNMPSGHLRFEGFCGDYGDVTPKWYYTE